MFRKSWFTRIVGSILCLTTCGMLFFSLGCGAGRHSGVQTHSDPFEGEVKGFVLYLDRAHLSALSAKEIRGSIQMEVMFWQRGQVDQVLPAGTNLQFRIGGQTRSLATKEKAMPVRNVYGYTVITQWKLPIELTQAQARTFASEALTAIRTADGVYAIEIESGDSETITEDFRELLSAAS